MSNIIYKYQNMNNSCLFSCIAMLLSKYSIDITDYKLVKDSFLPYMLKYRENRILAALMNQDENTLNKIVNKYKLKFNEINCYNWNEFKKNSDRLLTNNHPFIIGINSEDIFGENTKKAFPRKHAIVVQDKINNLYYIFNPVRKNTEFENIKELHFNEGEFKSIIESIKEKPFKLAFIKKPVNIDNINCSENVKKIKEESFEAIKYIEIELNNVSTLDLNYDKYMDLIFRYIKPLVNDLCSALEVFTEKENYKNSISLLFEIKKITLEIQKEIKIGSKINKKFEKLNQKTKDFCSLYKNIIEEV